MSHPQPVDSMVYPRHSGVATFMRYPHIPDARGLDVVIVGVPFDTAAGYRVGARLAPRAIRHHSSQVRLHHPIHDVTVHEKIRIADADGMLAERRDTVVAPFTGPLVHLFPRLDAWADAQREALRAEIKTLVGL